MTILRRLCYLTTLAILATLIAVGCSSEPIGSTPTAIPTMEAPVAPTSTSSPLPPTTTPEPTATVALDEGVETPEDVADMEAPANPSAVTWALLSLGDTPALANSSVTFEVVDDSRITGWTGCNQFRASYELVGDAVAIGDIVLTSDNPCPSEAAQTQEDLYLSALEQATAYQVSEPELGLVKEPNSEPVAIFRLDREDALSLTGAPPIATPSLAAAKAESEAAEAEDEVTQAEGETTTIVEGSAETQEEEVSEAESETTETVEESVQTQEEVAEAEVLATEPADDVTQLPQLPDERTEAAQSTEQDTSNWVLLALGDTPSLDNLPATFEVAGGGRITGWTGCNDFSATYESVGDAVFISDIVLTSDNSCPSEAAQTQEDLYLTNLEKARAFQASGEGLSLLDTSGEPVATFISASGVESTPASSSTVPIPEPTAATAGDDAVETQDDSAQEEPPAIATETEGAESQEEATVSETLVEPDSTGWLLLALGDTPSLASLPVTLEIAGGGRISGWTGCNDFSATYESVGDAVFISDIILTSENLCRSEAAQIQEDLYLAALEKVRSYQMSGAELSLVDANTEPVAKFLSALTLELENTNWVAAAYDDGEGSLAPVSTDGPAITAILQANRISGFSGCANYQADYSVDGNTIQVDNLTGGAAGTTSADCTGAGPTLDQDARYRKALQSAATYELTGPHLTFYTEDGGAAVTYLAIAAIEQAE